MAFIFRNEEQAKQKTSKKGTALVATCFFLVSCLA
jgi:hypothetical protein